MKTRCKLKRPRNTHTWMFYQSQIFKQNITIQKSCHSKPHVAHQFEQRCECTGASSQELQICFFLFDLGRILTSQFSFLAARLVGLFLRALWPKYKRFNREHENWNIGWLLRYEKYVIQLSPNLLSTNPSILPYLRYFHLLFKLLSPPGSLLNFPTNKDQRMHFLYR